MLNLENRWLRGDISIPYSIQKEVLARWLLASSPAQPEKGQEVIASFCSRAGSSCTLSRIFSEKVVKHWNELPRVMLESPSLKVLKKQLDMALYAMV